MWHTHIDDILLFKRFRRVLAGKTYGMIGHDTIGRRIVLFGFCYVCVGDRFL